VRDRLKHPDPCRTDRGRRRRQDQRGHRCPGCPQTWHRRKLITCADLYFQLGYQLLCGHIRDDTGMPAFRARRGFNILARSLPRSRLRVEVGLAAGRE